MAFNVLTQEQGKALFRGELNRNTVPGQWPVPEKVLVASADQNRRLEIDLSELAHVDTSGVAWLLKVLQAAKANKLTVTLTHVPDNLRKLAKISDVESLLPIQ